MEQYIKAVKTILNTGIRRRARNGDRISVFDYTMDFDMNDGMPIVTTKETKWLSSFLEMIWMLSGSTNTKDLVKLGSPNIWRQWSDNKGSIGPMYGHLLRHWPNPSGSIYMNTTYSDIRSNTAPDVPVDSIAQLQHLLDTEADQLWYVINNIKNNPNSTRHRLTTYNPAFLPIESLSPQDNILRGKGALTPCHGISTIFRVEDNYLSMSMTSASCDILLGGAYNIAQYAFLLHVIAKETNLIPGTMSIKFVDLHIYANQIDALMKANYLDREPLPLPQLKLTDDWNLWNFDGQGIELENYQCHPFIKLPVS